MTSILLIWQASPASPFKFADFSATFPTSSFNELSQSVGWTHMVQYTQQEVPTWLLILGGRIEQCIL